MGRDSQPEPNPVGKEWKSPPASPYQMQVTPADQFTYKNMKEILE